MLFLAGLISMVAVGTAAMWGFEDLGTSDARDDIGTPGDASDEASDYDNGTAAYSGAQDSLLDIATDDDPEGDDYGIARGTADADTLSGGEVSEFLDGLDGDDRIASGTATMSRAAATVTTRLTARPATTPFMARPGTTP